MRVIWDAVIREVPIGELNRSTSVVINSVRRGERLIVTRHGEPRAVVLSVDDVIEAMVELRMPEYMESAERDFVAGDVVEPWPHAGPLRIVLATAAARGYRHLGARDRGGIRSGLRGAEADPACPLWLPTGRWLVPFSYPESDVALVHALVDVRELEREVIGEEICRARLRRSLDRNAHARAPWQPRPAAISRSRRAS
jgi:prevent-host-death family protein